MQITWKVRPLEAPAVEKHCARCGKVLFRSSGLFRVNAQQKTLSVWLVWRCEECGRTWNMDVHSRVHKSDLDPGLYQGYADNDPELALACAFDPALHKKNGTTPLLAEVPFEVEGEPVLLQPEGTVEIRILCELPMPVKLTQVLAAKLGVSAGELQRWEAREQIRVVEGLPLKRAKLGAETVIRLSGQRG